MRIKTCFRSLKVLRNRFLIFANFVHKTYFQAPLFCADEHGNSWENECVLFDNQFDPQVSAQ